MKKDIFGEFMLGAGYIGAAAAVAVGACELGWRGALVAAAGIAAATLVHEAKKMVREEAEEKDEFGIDEKKATVKLVKDDGTKCGVKIKKMGRFDTVAESFACILAILNAAEQNAKGSKGILFELIEKYKQEEPELMRAVEIERIIEKETED